MARIVLASASPRRKELLEQMGIAQFRVVSPDVDESVEAGLGPAEIVERLSLRKAQAAAGKVRAGDLVIAADTVVALDGTVLVTAANLDDARSADLDCALAGLGRIERVTGRVLAGPVGAHNTFDAPETVRPVRMEDVRLTEDGFKASLPPCCVAAFQVKPA